MSRSSSELDSEAGLGKGLEIPQPVKEEEKRRESHEEPSQPTSTPREGDLEKGVADDGLDRVESQLSVNNIRSVPNGGLRAWTQVVGSFFVFFNTWGIINAFGIYQTYYESGALFHSTPSDISWIGSLQGFLLMIVSSFAGPVYDAGYVRELIAVGSFFVVLGQMMLSLCTSYWQVLLAQGVCVGIGTGCLFVSGVAILSTYFSTRLATATGLAATGSSIGGMLYPIVFYRLQPHIGFAWATRVLGFIALGTLIIANLATKVRVVPAARRKVLDLDAFKEIPYLFFVMGTFSGFIGLYTVFFYVQTFVIEEHIMGPELAFYLLAILNAASTFGRFLPNLAADRVGPLNVVAPCAFLTSILCFCLIAARSSAAVIVIACFYGFFSGSFVSLPPTVFVHLSMHKRGLIGTRMGMGFAVTAVGFFIGTPIAGAILNASNFTYVWTFGGIFTAIAGICLTIARVSHRGWHPLVKA